MNGETTVGRDDVVKRWPVARERAIVFRPWNRRPAPGRDVLSPTARRRGAWWLVLLPVIGAVISPVLAYLGAISLAVFVGLSSLLFGVLAVRGSIASARERRQIVLVDKEGRMLFVVGFGGLRGGREVEKRVIGYRFDQIRRVRAAYWGHGGIVAHIELDDGCGGIEKVVMREGYGGLSLSETLQRTLGMKKDFRDMRDVGWAESGEGDAAS